MAVIIEVTVICIHLVSSRCSNYFARGQVFRSVSFLLVAGVISVMDISVETRAKVIALREHTSKTYEEIGKLCGVSTASVGRIWNRFQKTGNAAANRSGRCGRKRSTSARDDKTLHRMSVINPRLTSFDLSRTMAAAGVDIAPSTVRYRLLEYGRRARRPYKKQLLTSRMKKKRLEWARKYKTWTEKDWEKVLFSDETHFLVQGFRSKFVRRSKGEPLNQHHINQAPKHPPKKMFWGCFSVLGTESLVPVKGMMNSASYEVILNKKVIPTMSKLWPNGDCVFQQDSARCHTSKQIKNFCSKNKLTVLDWPGNSSDLNPIENLWAIVKKRLHKFDCTTMDKLISAVIDIWFRDHEIKTICASLVHSMPKRVYDVIKCRGAHINY